MLIGSHDLFQKHMLMRWRRGRLRPKRFSVSQITDRRGMKVERGELFRRSVFREQGLAHLVGGKDGERRGTRRAIPWAAA